MRNIVETCARNITTFGNLDGNSARALKVFWYKLNQGCLAPSTSDSIQNYDFFTTLMETYQLHLQTPDNKNLAHINTFFRDKINNLLLSIIDENPDLTQAESMKRRARSNLSGPYLRFSTTSPNYKKTFREILTTTNDQELAAILPSLPSTDCFVDRLQTFTRVFNFASQISLRTSTDNIYNRFMTDMLDMAANTINPDKQNQILENLDLFILDLESQNLTNNDNLEKLESLYKPFILVKKFLEDNLPKTKSDKILTELLCIYCTEYIKTRKQGSEALNKLSEKFINDVILDIEPSTTKGIFRFISPKVSKIKMMAHIHKLCKNIQEYSPEDSRKYRDIPKRYSGIAPDWFEDRSRHLPHANTRSL